VRLSKSGPAQLEGDISRWQTAIPFTIGQANTAILPGAETSLTRNEASANTVFVARNLDAGDGIQGQAGAEGIGVQGLSKDGFGVRGSGGLGVVGDSSGGVGVAGSSQSGDGVVGGSFTGVGVAGGSNSGTGRAGYEQHWRRSGGQRRQGWRGWHLQQRQRSAGVQR
jgi:hypothetical protein